VDVKDLIDLSQKKLISELSEDLGGKRLANDITSQKLLHKSQNIKCVISNRECIVLSGSIFVVSFLKRSFPKIKFKCFYNDGDKIEKDSKLFVIEGNARMIMVFERTILNFLQHLCGISTITKKFVTKMGKSKTTLLDTRKTVIGLRKIEKYATMIGGAKNHRMGLYDGILIKDNHIQIIGGIEKTLERLRQKKIDNYKIECDKFYQVKLSIDMGAKYILLDNMSVSEVKKCISIKNKKTIFEITGGITIDNITKYSKLNVEFISTSKITNSSYSVDIGLDII
tara:strand:+ start:25 stop:873 length:849 start_codon:yes stop_codon:yes gene_type:complete